MFRKFQQNRYTNKNSFFMSSPNILFKLENFHQTSLNLVISSIFFEIIVQKKNHLISWSLSIYLPFL